MNCFICFRRLNSTYKISCVNKDCLLQVHKNCIRKWISKTGKCPICRELTQIKIVEKNTNKVIVKLGYTYLELLFIKFSLFIEYFLFFLQQLVECMEELLDQRVMM